MSVVSSDNSQVFEDCDSNLASTPKAGARKFDERSSPDFVAPANKSRKMGDRNDEAMGASASEDWAEAFSEEKGYPSFAANFAMELSDKMGDRLVPKFVQAATELINKSTAPIKKDIGTLDQRVNQLMQDVIVIRTKNDISNLKIQENKEELLRQDADRRSNNLIFSGIPETRNENPDATLKKVLAQIKQIPEMENSNVHIERIYRFGRRVANKPRDICVKFLQFPIKQKVSSGRAHFSSGVYVKQDLPPAMASIHRALMPIKRTAEALPQYKDNKVKVTMGELVIDGKRYNLKNLQDIPSDIDILIGTFRMTQRIFAWFGVLNILSNFRWAPINVGGQLFLHNEQFIQYQKSMLFRDQLTAARIMEESNPFEVKKLGYKVQGFKRDVWERNLDKVAYECNKVKFDVHFDMANYLLSTYPKELAEASEEEPWGCGVALKNDDILNRDKWLRKNGVMGDTLMIIRQELYEERKSNSSRSSGGTSMSTPV